MCAVPKLCSEKNLYTVNIWGKAKKENKGKGKEGKNEDEFFFFLTHRVYVFFCFFLTK